MEGWPYLLIDQDEMTQLHRGPSIDASYQVSVHLAKWFQRRRYLEIDLWAVLYKEYSFPPDLLTNMAATGNSCF
jgi:hypothetical protein